MERFFIQYFSLSYPGKGCIYLENMTFLSDRLDVILFFFSVFLDKRQKLQEQTLHRHKTSPLVCKEQRFHN